MPLLLEGGEISRGFAEGGEGVRDVEPWPCGVDGCGEGWEAGEEGLDGFGELAGIGGLV